MSSRSPLTPGGIACLTVGLVLAVGAVVAAGVVAATSKPSSGPGPAPGQPRLPAPPTRVSISPVLGGVSVAFSVAAPGPAQVAATGVVVTAAPADAPGAACPAQPPSGALNTAVVAPPGGGPVLPPVFMGVTTPGACVWVATVGGDGSGAAPYTDSAPVATPMAVATGGPVPPPAPQLPTVAVAATPGPPAVVTATATGGTQPATWLLQWQVDGVPTGPPVAWSPAAAVLAQTDLADTHVYTAVVTVAGDTSGASAQGSVVVGGTGPGPVQPTAAPLVASVTPVGAGVVAAFSWVSATDSTQPAPPGSALSALQFSLDGGASFATVDPSLLTPTAPYPPVSQGTLALGAAQGLQPGGQYNLVLAATQTLPGGAAVQTTSSPPVQFTAPGGGGLSKFFDAVPRF